MFVGIYFALAVVCSLQLSNAIPHNNTEENSNIVFPGPVKGPGKNAVKIQQKSPNKGLTNKFGKGNTTHPCEGLTFCTVKPEDYPQELFNRMFKGKYKEPFQPALVMTDDRTGDDDENSNEKLDCDTKVSYDPLYQIRDIHGDGDWNTVVQAPDENFQQLVRMELCMDPDAKCFKKFVAPVDLDPFCKQKYGVWEFLVYDGKNGTKKVKTDIPSCCVCQYKEKID